ncbi:MAG: hypothetical protein MJE68_31245, partial [Proteobacteria bacterium]|nr:hypothetical protein [Pseudomonadota bacterium]
CERFNRTMFGLLRTLSKEQKAEWPVHLPSLVFAYNATPHSTTGLQSYQLMFGRKAPAPCDKWLGLGEYDDNRSASKAQWVDEQSERVRAANKRAMKKIKAAAAKNRKVVGGKDLDIPPGNLVLIRDHPEGRNKIQDQNKPDLYVVVSNGERPNNYWVQPLGAGGPTRQVNRRELFDLGVDEDGMVQEKEEQKEEEEEEEEDQTPFIPSFDPKPVQGNTEPKVPYSLRPRPVPAPRKLGGEVTSVTY